MRPYKLNTMVDGSGGQHGQEGPTASRPTYRLIQILRAMAALMVVAHHASIMLAQRCHLAMPNWINGASGVDIFFVISGFVMAISSAPLAAAGHPAKTFLARRMERVVPMYWLVTTIKVVVLVLVPALGLNALGGARHVLLSYLFWPSVNPQGSIEPVVVVGWTLSFEMGFYMLFALALALRVKPLWILLPCFVMLGLWPLFHVAASSIALQFFANTLPLEFVFGLLLGMFVGRIRRIPWGWGAVLFLGGLLPLFVWGSPMFTVFRGLQWGPAAVAVVMGALSLEARWGARSPRWMLEMGDASYSIYLVHTFALPLVGVLINRMHSVAAGGVGEAMVVSILLSALAGEGVYRAVERPLVAWFKGRRRTAVPAASLVR